MPASFSLTLDGSGTPVTSGNPLPVSLPSGFATATAQATSNAALGAPADVEASGDGSLIALLKRLRTLLAATLTVRVSGGTTSTVTIVTLTAATATQLAASNASRRTLSLCNTGTGLAAVGFANTVTASTGWPLAAATASGDQGGGYEFPAAAVHTGAVWAYSTAGTTIAVLEG